LFSETGPDAGTLSVFVPEDLAGTDLQEIINRNNTSEIHTEKIFFFINLPLTMKTTYFNLLSIIH
jgi:hypothetical protein